MYFKHFAICVVVCDLGRVLLGESTKQLSSYNSLIDHTAVQDTTVFPYAVAILKKYSYLCAGALLNDKWVLTAADSLYAIRESSRVLRVRLGSINYKKGGVLIPVKRIVVHPQFDDSKPAFDLALLRLAHEVLLTPNLRPIKMQKHPKNTTATHFIVVAWKPALHVTSSNHGKISMDTIKRSRFLTLSHLHPSEPTNCIDQLDSLEVNYHQALMCLEPDLKSDPCWRDTGAPVVLNDVLWGVISSWRYDNCKTEVNMNFVNLVSAKNVSSWINYIILNDDNWHSKVKEQVEEDNVAEEDSSNSS